MGQMYLQRFVNRDGATKSALDEAWGEAFKVFAQTGSWGGVDGGVTHHQTYGTGWGGLVLIEVEIPRPSGATKRSITRRTASRFTSHGNPCGTWIGPSRRPSATCNEGGAIGQTC